MCLFRISDPDTDFVMIQLFPKIWYLIIYLFKIFCWSNPPTFQYALYNYLPVIEFILDLTCPMTFWKRIYHQYSDWNVRHISANSQLVFILTSLFSKSIIFIQPDLLIHLFIYSGFMLPSIVLNWFWTGSLRTLTRQLNSSRCPFLLFICTFSNSKKNRIIK